MGIVGKGSIDSNPKPHGKGFKPERGGGAPMPPDLPVLLYYCYYILNN